MPIPHASEPSSIKPAIIPNEVLTSIGRLVRAFAEIDDLITLYICGLAGISESKAMILLGRSQASTKIDIALYLAKMTGSKITEIHNTLFNEQYRECRKYRNTVAHGVFMGMTDDGLFAFLTSETADPEEFAAVQIVLSLSAKTILDAAEGAEKSIPQIIATLKLESLRQRRLQRPLRPTQKGLNQRTSKTKHPPPH